MFLSDMKLFLRAASRRTFLDWFLNKVVGAEKQEGWQQNVLSDK